MKEFVLIFRSSHDPHAQPSPAQLQERMNWMAGIAARNQLADKGKRLSAADASTIKPGNVVAAGPYTANGEFVAGYMIIKAEDMEAAISIAQSNPILQLGGNIEVRAVLAP
ncbi:YciI family protein [Chitinophaga vietnamensis]|uniref:YciI family protein n=1 Tax=Chitinophaga vietnamensis TaxID=2593957 RepID=UPI0011773C80|nr:YciI family protein [Chitinophaga vietnamensis]